MNTFITPTWVTKDVAVNWKNNIKLVGQFDRSWDDSWQNKPQGAQIGYTVQARIQQRWVVNEGQALVTQPILNQTVPISLNHQFQVGMGWSSADDALVVEEVQSRYTKPAGQALANKMDVVAGAEVYKSVYYAIGSPGVPITDDTTYTDGIAKLRNVGVPQDLVVVLDPKSQSRLLAANFALFNPQAQISKYFKSGQFSGAALGADEWYWDPNMPTFTTGTFTTATPVVAGANQTGSSLALSGMGTYAMVAGDIFTIDGVNAVNPVSYNDTGDLQQFTLVSPLSGTTTGTFIISPAIITSGPLQTVTASPANLAAVTWLGATGTVAATMAATKSKQSLMFNPAAFAFVMADLKEKLPGAVSKRISDKDSALSMRFVEQYNIQTDQLPSRIDAIAGVAPVLPYFALRIFS
jgi:P22 coat protein - gene protein 5